MGFLVRRLVAGDAADLKKTAGTPSDQAEIIYYMMLDKGYPMQDNLILVVISIITQNKVECKFFSKKFRFRYFSLQKRVNTFQKSFNMVNFEIVETHFLSDRFLDRDEGLW
ncbi:hypothetical protein C6501_02045 [Candidatus Poribacteria bacterium]|nr:MAG: hypothetical protein C6501_02045 [Candidatus Poribacteria bacterium]